MSLQDIPPVPAQGSEPPPERRARWPRVLAWLVGALLLLVVTVVVVIVLALRTETGTRQLWSIATRLSAGALSGTFDGGTVANGLRLRDVVFAQGDMRVAVDRLDGKWTMGLGIGDGPARLHVAWLRLGNVDVRLPASEPQPDKAPATMPDSLRLPLAIDVDSLTVQRLSLVQGPSVTASPLVFSDLAAALHSDGERHRLSIDNLQTPYGKLRANAQIAGQAPFPLSAEALLSGDWQEQSFTVNATARGALDAVRVEAEISGDPMRARANADVTPFGQVPFTRLQVQGERIDPRAFVPTAPQASLSVQADLRPVTPAGGAAGPLTVAGDVSVRNHEAGPLDAERLPVESVRAHVELSEGAQSVRDLVVQLPARRGVRGDPQGEVRGSGSLRDGRGGFDLDVRRLDPQAIHGALRSVKLSGPVIVRLEPGRQSVALDVAGGEWKLFADARIDPDNVTLAALRASVGPGTLHAEGKLGLREQQAFSFKGKLTNLDPARLAEVARGRINADFTASGTLAGEPRVAVDFGIQGSEYAGLPMTGAGKVRLAGQRLLPSEATVSMAGNRADVRGSFGAPGDRLRLVVDAPQLDRLKFGVGGMLSINADIAGTLQRPQVTGDYEARSLVIGPHRVASASGRAEMRGGLQGPLLLRLAARDYRGPLATLRTLDVSLDGTQAAHTFDVKGVGQLRQRPLNLTLAGRGGWDGSRWSGTIDTLEERGNLSVRLLAPMQLSANAQRVTLGATRLMVERATLRIDSLDWNAGRIRTAGALDGLQVAHVLEMVRTFTGEAPPVRSDLVIDGRWDLNLAETAGGFAELRRRSGDLSVQAGRGYTALGLGETGLRADAAGGRVNLRGGVVSTRFGAISVDAFAGLVVQQGLQTVGPASPLGGKVSLDIPRVEALEALMGPQYGFDGRLAAALQLAGTVAEPLLTGSINGDALSVTLYDQGIRLTDGIVRIALDRNLIQLRQVEFRGGDGRLTATGDIRLGGGDPNLSATIVADKLQLFASPERTLVLSGQARIASEAEQLAIRGKFRVDRGLFDLPRESAPVLGDDVVVVRRSDQREVKTAGSDTEEPQPASRFSPVIDVTVDLGSNFRFKGAGADLRLAGEIGVNSAPLTPMRATGTVRVVDGTYEAFGRRLTITRGIVHFNGPLNNPNINIRAMRLNQEVEAGVEVTGTVRLPRVRLVSEPNVPDEDKLSWLMFGYGAEGSGMGQQALSGSALGGAALGMLGTRAGKGVVQRFGIDEFSIGPSTAGLNEQQVVSVGKALTEKISVGYEQSLTSASNVVKVTWAFSRRWSLLAKGGSINGLSVLFNRRFDDWSALFGGRSGRRDDNRSQQDGRTDNPTTGTSSGNAAGDPQNGTVPAPGATEAIRR
ncbi:translocation/assembly module TamB [Cupriavidus respiraculi]|uniref:translocation/assembly module TamB domain-containing protein n=1 Tax=Cupriavidus respiraculi TaxID=195930 RepID=UPI001C978CF9|nr:translocation/assembly module TamB domain-containing protein [Cupriavidus respiraculi]MBY4949131.1 translocation/assembly module TamB [Cupriavidus respiraculi]